jgi:hypothetical protein
MAKWAARPGLARARHGSACIGPVIVEGRAVPAHEPHPRPKPSLGWLIRAVPAQHPVVLGGSGRPLAD